MLLCCPAGVDDCVVVPFLPGTRIELHVSWVGERASFCTFVPRRFPRQPSSLPRLSTHTQRGSLHLLPIVAAPRSPLSSFRKAPRARAAHLRSDSTSRWVRDLHPTFLQLPQRPVGRERCLDGIRWIPRSGRAPETVRDHERFRHEAKDHAPMPPFRSGVVLSTPVSRTFQVPPFRCLRGRWVHVAIPTNRKSRWDGGNGRMS